MMTTDSILTTSPAKINLMLRVLGQRDDGYHLLQTYFQLLDWGDGMEFILSEEDSISINGQFPNLKTEDNLIYKAAELLQPHKKSSQGIIINVDKNIPQGSGLGGGSSNAATTLRVLNDIWQCQLSNRQLQQMAIKLGADVPVFVLNSSAMASGIGEILTPYSIEPYYFVLVFPQTGIATAEVFSSKKLLRDQQAIAIEQINDPKNWSNACLPVVLENYPEVAQVYQRAAKFSAIFMSGTGSTLFSYFHTLAEAQQFINQIPQAIKTQICRARHVSLN
ncbi:MAG TPA: 4-(cytidine 5'-diphospho)-2-C-methyl-D-erythritol kinase [Oceanospirillales bacterium]|nr:4-(cytidine 5'-diphospho)-2-C-methyl-D-erythritol kinase [Oceanospirillales bacterium]